MVLREGKNRDCLGTAIPVRLKSHTNPLTIPPYIWGSGGMSWDATGVMEAKVSRDTRCPGQSPSWDGVGCPRTPRVVPGHLRCPRTVLSQDGQLSWDGRRRSRTALLGHQVSRDTTSARVPGHFLVLRNAPVLPIYRYLPVFEPLLISFRVVLVFGM